MYTLGFVEVTSVGRAMILCSFLTCLPLMGGADILSESKEKRRQLTFTENKQYARRFTDSADTSYNNHMKEVLLAHFQRRKSKVREMKYFAHVKASKAEVKIICWTSEPMLSSLF